MIQLSLLVVFFALGSVQARSDVDSLPPGSVVIVRGKRSVSVGETVRSTEAIAVRSASTLEGVVASLPGAQVYTNTRGEAVVSIRGSQERQVAVYQDGAPLALPWDQRVDLSLLPSAMLSRIELVRASPSVLYGPWGAGGVVNLSTRDPFRDSVRSVATAQGGMGGARSFNVVSSRSEGDKALILGAGWFGRDAQTVGDGTKADDLPPTDVFQTSSQYRTNSDLNTRWAMIQMRLRKDSLGGAGITAQIADGSKGDPPSGYRGDSPRFWRYPQWRLVRTSMNAQADWTESIRTNGTVWATSLEQVIDKYKTETYGLRTDRESGHDQDWGGRVVGSFRHEKHYDVTVAFQGDYSRHDQIDESFDSLGRSLATPELSYRQVIGSAGLEAGWFPIQDLRLEAGAAWDGASTLEAGDKGRVPGQGAFGGTVMLEWRAFPGFVAHLASGQRTRFASMRELYGEALKTFAPNPDLKPETIQSIEAGAAWNGRFAKVGSTVFVRKTDQLVDQIRIPDPKILKNKLRKRVNLDEAWARGVEGEISFKPLPWLSVSGDILVLDAWAEDSISKAYDAKGRLTKTPDLNSHLQLAASLGYGFECALDWARKGESWDRDPNNTKLISLGASDNFGLHLGWTEALPSQGIGLQVYLDATNLSDEPAQSQLGLLEPGRTVLLGVKISL